MPVNNKKSWSTSGVPMYGSEFGRKFLYTLFGVLIAYSIVFLGVLIRNEIKKYNYIGRGPGEGRSITIEALGKVTATPDIAKTTMGMTADGKTVAEAQAKNTTVMNALITKLKALGIAPEDIKTSGYNIYPKYNYTERGGQELVGYEVQQQVTVKIRDLSTSNQVLALAGEVGANSVSGIEFTLDDPEVYKSKARELALQKVAEKARALSHALGVKIVGVMSYNEFEGGGPPVYRSLAFDGMGGAPEGAPTIEPGSNEVVVNASVTFEIR